MQSMNVNVMSLQVKMCVHQWQQKSAVFSFIYCCLVIKNQGELIKLFDFDSY